MMSRFVLKILLLIFILSLLVLTSCSVREVPKISERILNGIILFGNASFVSGDSLPVDVFSFALDSGNFTVIDLRGPNELEDLGIINGTDLNYNFYGSDFMSQLNILNKSSSYLLYCYSGHRSDRVKNYLLARNFSSVFDLDGGIEAWIKKGFPVERDFLVMTNGTIVYGLTFFR